MRVRLLSLAVAVLTGLGLGLVATPSHASTGGEIDGDRHPNVGLIAFYDADGRWRCSATLISPQVVLTAAHCTSGTIGKTLVTFESFIGAGPDSPLPKAADPSAGYTSEELAAGGYHSGTAYTHDEYSHFTDLDNWYDVGVIVLDDPIVDIAPAELAPVGTSDAIKRPRSTIFTAVGYGTEVRQAESGPQNPRPHSYPIVRRFVEMPGQKITPQVIQTNGNEHDPFGTGGSCFGDSGGPLLLGDRIVGVTSYGYTSNCRYIGGYQRVDIQGVADWLAQFPI